MNAVDRLLDSITMYRLLLYYLIALLGVAMVFGAFGLGSYSPIAIACSAAYLTGACWAINKAFARILKVPVNPESSLITALILALILTPPASAEGYVFLTAAAGLAIASKYLLTIRNHNIFNPAAIAVVLTSFGAGESASWWIGSAMFVPFVVLGGVLVARKIQRLQMVGVFIGVSIAVMAILTTIAGGSVADGLQKMALSSPLFFLAFVMLTEPLTSPTTRTKQWWFAAIVGALFPPQIHVLGVYATPELALVIGNVFSYIVERKPRLVLPLHMAQPISQTTADFIFTPNRPMQYQPGQYMEWTLPHAKPDSRGSRRYFTLASSPTEDTLRIGVKFYRQGSTYKQAMLKLNPGATLAAGQLGGDFVLPKDPREKLVFIAGGIGITPYRSMLKYLIDTDQKRNIVLVYSAQNKAEVVYTDVISQAQRQFGTKVVYALRDEPAASPGIYPGRISTELIKTEIPDFAERIYYLSGPHQMVAATKHMLRQLGIPGSHIKTDFFPGYV